MILGDKMKLIIINYDLSDYFDYFFKLHPDIYKKTLEIILQ